MLNNDITIIKVTNQWDENLIDTPGIDELYPGNSPYIKELLPEIYPSTLPPIIVGAPITWALMPTEDFDEEELMQELTQTGIYAKITRDNTFSQIMCMRFDESTDRFVSDLNTSKFNGYEFNLFQAEGMPFLITFDPTVQILSLTKGLIFVKSSDLYWGEFDWRTLLPPSVWDEDDKNGIIFVPDYYPLKTFFKKLADEINFNNERYSSHMFRAGCPKVSGIKHISWKDIEATFLSLTKSFGSRYSSLGWIYWRINRYKLTHPDGYTQYVTEKILKYPFST